MEQIITKLKQITPDESFRKRSRALILATQQNSPVPMPFFNFNWRINLAAGGILVILLGASGLYLGGNSRKLAAQDNLTKEANNLELNIQLSQAQYYADSAQQIELALTQLSQ